MAYLVNFIYILFFLYIQLSIQAFIHWLYEYFKILFSVFITGYYISYQKYKLLKIEFYYFLLVIILVTATALTGNGPGNTKVELGGITVFEIIKIAMLILLNGYFEAFHPSLVQNPFQHLTLKDIIKNCIYAIWIIGYYFIKRIFKLLRINVITDKTQINNLFNDIFIFIKKLLLLTLFQIPLIFLLFFLAIVSVIICRDMSILLLLFGSFIFVLIPVFTNNRSILINILYFCAPFIILAAIVLMLMQFKNSVINTFISDVIGLRKVYNRLIVYDGNPLTSDNAAIYKKENFQKSAYQIGRAQISVQLAGIYGWCTKTKTLGIPHKYYTDYLANPKKSIKWVMEDFVFMGIAESYGFIGTSIILSVFLIFYLWTIRLGIHFLKSDLFGGILILMLGASIFIQVIINFANTYAILPTVGINLPFFSTGFTSFTVISFIFGLLAGFEIKLKKNLSLFSSVPDGDRFKVIKWIDGYFIAGISFLIYAVCLFAAYNISIKQYNKYKSTNYNPLFTQLKQKMYSLKVVDVNNNTTESNRNPSKFSSITGNIIKGDFKDTEGLTLLNLYLYKKYFIPELFDGTKRFADFETANIPETIYTTIDFKVLESLNKKFAKYLGAGIIVNAQTGGILAMNSFSGKKKSGSSFNRLLNSRYLPGSTFKILNMLLALENPEFDPKNIYSCHGSETIAGSSKQIANYHDKVWGDSDGYSLFAVSANSYFLHIFQEYIDKLPAEKINLFYKNFKFNSEFDFIYPIAKSYIASKKSEEWSPYLSIGQGPCHITPFHSVYITNIIYRKGKIQDLFFIDRIVNKKNKILIQRKKTINNKLINLSRKDSWDILWQMMRNTVLFGTCSGFNNLSAQGIEVYAKTGTAQRSKKSKKEGDIGWVTGFAIDTQKRKPDIVFSVVIENYSSSTVVKELQGIIKDYFIKD